MTEMWQKLRGIFAQKTKTKAEIAAKNNTAASSQFQS